MSINDDSISVAHDYAERGWSIIPVPLGQKAPIAKNWPKLRITPKTVSEYFNGEPQNIGVLMGEPSGWLIDIDLDHDLSVELASKFLPPTGAVFGRSGKRNSHYIYRVTGAISTKKFSSRSAGMLVEVRSTGQQTVFPGSTHVSGEPIEWSGEDISPAEIEPEILLDAATALANEVKVRLGEKAALKKTTRRDKPTVQAGELADRDEPPEGHDEMPSAMHNCLRVLQRMQLTDSADGSLRLYWCGCRCVDFDLNDSDSLCVIREYARSKPFPREWSDAEILKRIRDAEKIRQRGIALERDEDGYSPLGWYDHKTGKLVLSREKTLPTAQAYVRTFCTHEDGQTIACYGGELLTWRNGRYELLEDSTVKKQLQKWLHEALTYILDKDTKSLKLVQFSSNPGSINSAIESIKSFVQLPITIPTPSWLDSSNHYPTNEILACKTKILLLPTMEVTQATPKLFVRTALEFDFDFDAPEPERWLEFLNQLFGDDIESIELLQEWFGYCLTADTTQQKMLLIVGPKRSGKGTVGRVLTQLIGASNVVGPTTGSLAGQFGLQSLVGKSLAVVSDARFRGHDMPIVVERLLCVSGEDSITIDRKHLSSVTMKLPIRFMFLTNEIPRLADTSGALASRFLVLQLTKSFYGHEDVHLTNNLVEELPGILNWSIHGWQRLRDRGSFVMPSSAEEVVQSMADLGSPVFVFVQERCEIGSGVRVDTADLFFQWSQWCEANGHRSGTAQDLGRNLRSVIPKLQTRRSTGGQAFFEGVGLN